MSFFFRLITPISKLIGKIHAPFSTRLIVGDDFYSIQAQVQSGDIILSQVRWHLTNLFIPGMWKHAAIVVDNKTIVEATGEGVHFSSLYDFISTKDYLIVLRLKSDDKTTPVIASAISQKFVGCGYDYEFDNKNNQYFCSEVADTAYRMAGVELITPTNYLGISRIAPIDLYESQKLKVIYASKRVKL
jgi:uncharacterized protein YycO